MGERFKEHVFKNVIKQNKLSFVLSSVIHCSNLLTIISRSNDVKTFDHILFSSSSDVLQIRLRLFQDLEIKKKNHPQEDKKQKKIKYVSKLDL